MDGAWDVLNTHEAASRDYGGFFADFNAKLQAEREASSEVEQGIELVAAKFEDVSEILAESVKDTAARGERAAAVASSAAEQLANTLAKIDKRKADEAARETSRLESSNASGGLPFQLNQEDDKLEGGAGESILSPGWAWRAFFFWVVKAVLMVWGFQRVAACYMCYSKRVRGQQEASRIP